MDAIPCAADMLPMGRPFFFAVLLVSLAAPGSSAAVVEYIETTDVSYSYTSTGVCSLTVETLRVLRTDADGVVTYLVEMTGTGDAGLPWEVTAVFDATSSVSNGAWVGSACGKVLDPLWLTVHGFDCANGHANIEVGTLDFALRVHAQAVGDCMALPDDLL